MKKATKNWAFMLVLMLMVSFITGCTATTPPASTSQAASSETSSAETPAAKLDYPTKPIELVVPFGAGGAHDLYSRVIAAVLPKYIGMPVNVNILSGGSGTIGSDYAAKAAPDGYTLMLTGPSPGIALLHTRDDLTYGIDSFDYIAYINGANSVIEVPANSPFKTLEELFAYAKENPGKLRYASSGVYSASHITTESIADDIGCEFVHVPYDSGGASSTAVLAGEVDFGILTITASRSLIEGGKLRALAVTTDERDTGTLKDVPTMKELGYDGIYFTNSRYLVAPKGVQPEILKYISDACSKMVEDPEFIELVKNMGEEVEYMNGEELKKWVDDNYKSLEPTMKRLAAKQ
ncbi:MAG: tripartite tricarboxylate transporter substrate binding protein [Angelakisella sp.]|nr:tripartite tricarboxylate transporter substrate binding protein [Angelakisella sp.]